MLGKRFFIFIFILSADALWAHSPKKNVDRIYNHLFLKDYFSATREAKEGLAKDPSSDALRFALIRSHALCGQLGDAFEEWNMLDTKKIETKTARSLMESLAWGVISSYAHQLQVHLTAVVGAALTNDARGIPLIVSSIHSSNALVRSVTAQYARSFRDQRVVDALSERLAKEKVWYVRLELMRTLGMLRIRSASNALIACIENEQSTMEERHTAMAALCNSREDVDRDTVQKLVKSNRIGERHLACGLVLGFGKKDFAVLLTPLLSDDSPVVRVAAINAFALLSNGKDLWEAPVKELLDDANGEVSLTAAWALAHHRDERGMHALKAALLSPFPHMRQIASSALGLLSYGREQELVELMRAQLDPFVRLNLARGIISAGSSHSYALDQVAHILENMNQKLMVTSGINPLFSVVTPSNVRHMFGVSQYPQYVDKQVRLELVNMLAVRRHPKAEGLTKAFLRTSQLGVSFNAALILCQEGSEESLELVQSLLTDVDPNIRLQAAIVMAFLGEREQAFPILRDVYPMAKRETKIHIIQAMAYLRSKEATNFLLEIMQQPHLVLRVIAASSLIQSIYN